MASVHGSGHSDCHVAPLRCHGVHVDSFLHKEGGHPGGQGPGLWTSENLRQGHVPFGVGSFGYHCCGPCGICGKWYPWGMACGNGSRGVFIFFGGKKQVEVRFGHGMCRGAFVWSLS